MIFITVGSQMPFDRLIRMVDEWAGRCGQTDILAQIGSTRLHPKHIEYVPFLGSKDFRRTMQAADQIISHAGIGTLLMSFELGKPLLVMPRQAKFRETRNDHQVATARYFAEQKSILVAYTAAQFSTQIETLCGLQARPGIVPDVSQALVERLRKFVREAI